jgi:predicted ABC-type ATPase
MTFEVLGFIAGRATGTIGYEVGLVFVTLNSADLNVQRVADRVARGGHNIAETVIQRRYETALRRLPVVRQQFIVGSTSTFANPLSVCRSEYP